MARLIEGTLETADAERVRNHLRSCRRCFETYHDSAVYSHLYGSDPRAFAATKESREIGYAAVYGAVTPQRDQKRRSLTIRPAVGVTVACIVLLAAAVTWHRVARRSGGYTVGEIDIAPVRAAVETASSYGPYVLPGGERLLESAGDVYRSGSVPLNDALESSLERLSAIYRSEHVSNDAAYWLAAGKYVTGQIDIARDVTVDARRKFPDDTRIAVVAALIAHADGDHAGAEDLLRGIFENNPDDAVAGLNLAVVLADRGRLDAARMILEKVRSLHAGSPPAARATSMLLDMEDGRP